MGRGAGEGSRGAGADEKTTKKGRANNVKVKARASKRNASQKIRRAHIIQTGTHTLRLR